MADTTVDARGLQCPMPVIKLSQALKAASSGQTIELLSTDKGSCSDVPAWTDDMGFTITESFEEDGVFHFVIAKP